MNYFVPLKPNILKQENAMRKIIVTVAPVCHVGKEIPAECKNPLTPEEIAEDTINCYKAGACEVHLHTRDLQGNPTFELDVFRQTIGLIRQETDMIVQGSTGGLSTLTLAERCVSLDVPEVEVASLNMGHHPRLDEGLLDAGLRYRHGGIGRSRRL
jgi:3-keto-5-aminohexanoate cleavage enzyme